MSAFGGRRERVSVFISDFGNLVGTVLKDIISVAMVVVHVFTPST